MGAPEEVEARPSTALLWATVVAAPVALGFETALRRLLFPADFELVRDLLREPLTPVAWGLVGLAALGSALGLWLQQSLARRRLARMPPGAPRSVRHAAVTAVFLLTTVPPQLPSILATFCFMFGSPLAPVLASIAVTTVGVGGQAARVRRLAEPPGPS